ncbi:uncharacterized protein [Periplaneta americana]|uniref:uncharacterized protein n=1 Tax=Periplaneta americana TaxID=6978 RepID=UPI0037E9C836
MDNPGFERDCESAIEMDVLATGSTVKTDMLETENTVETDVSKTAKTVKIDVLETENTVETDVSKTAKTVKIDVLETENTVETDVSETAKTVKMDVLETANGSEALGCSEMCLRLHQQHQKALQEYQKYINPRPLESPWHPLKTVFLVINIVVILVWIVVYTVLSQYNML